ETVQKAEPGPRGPGSSRPGGGESPAQGSAESCGQPAPRACASAAQASAPEACLADPAVGDPACRVGLVKTHDQADSVHGPPPAAPAFDQSPAGRATPFERGRAG